MSILGIDDDFLMLAAWRELDFRIPLHQKVALVMADAGASITVTSFTNFFCFGRNAHRNVAQNALDHMEIPTSLSA